MQQKGILFQEEKSVVCLCRKGTTEKGGIGAERE